MQPNLNSSFLSHSTGGGLETDSYQHVSSALHVIRTLTTAQTPSNPESSRAGFFYEIQIQDRAILKAKIHACFVDHVRVTNLKREERSFNIFYQLLAGERNIASERKTGPSYMSRFPVDVDAET